MAMGGEGNDTALLPSGHICREFSLAEILSATHNFHEDLVIGKGGFGKVYKGFIDDGVTTIAAIKRLHVNSSQGADEFWTEVKMLTRFRHCNLVSLIGFCSEKEMILVYEYMRNGTLHDHLHKAGSFLSWIQRLKICVGAARGLDYLHTGASIRHRIIHRDVKSANILLDDNLAARIADFGLSKVGPADQSHSYVSTNVKGTPGYIDPEYFNTGQLTSKSDVYSFGVVLFEVLCGKRAVHPNSNGRQQSLASWVKECIAEGQLDEIIDSRLRGEVVPECLKQFAEIANKCLESSSKKRPTMAEVVFKLELALSFQQPANPPADENVDSAMVNIDSQRLDGDEVYGIEDEWIMSDESSSSYVKPVNKVKVFDSVSNKLNVEPAAEQEVIDDDGNGPYEDETILNETSNVQSNGGKITFSTKVKNFFTTTVRKNPGHNDQTPSRSVLNCATKNGELKIFNGRSEMRNKKLHIRYEISVGFILLHLYNCVFKDDASDQEEKSLMLLHFFIGKIINWPLYYSVLFPSLPLHLPHSNIKTSTSTPYHGFEHHP